MGVSKEERKEGKEWGEGSKKKSEGELGRKQGKG